jgi:hypothetical protein
VPLFLACSLVLQKCADQLLAMIGAPGVNFAGVEQFINVGLKEFSIKITPQLQQRIRRVRELYLRSLRDHLLQRFPNVKLLSAFAAVFDPSRYPDSEAAIRQHAVSDIKIICQQFGFDKELSSQPAHEGRAAVAAGAEMAMDESPAETDPWDDPDFKLPDVDVLADESGDDFMADAHAKESKDTQRTVKALVNVDECIGELYGFRNWLMATNGDYLKHQLEMSRQQSNAASLIAAQRKNAANKSRLVANRVAGKDKPAAAFDPANGSRDHPVVVDGKEPAAEADEKKAKPGVAVPGAGDEKSAKAIRNLSMSALILLFLNDPSCNRSYPNITRSV